MSYSVVCIRDAAGLPPEWDQLADGYFQEREFLRHCQEYNPCNQRYYLASREGKLEAGAVLYSLALDLFTYLKLKSPVTMQIAGVPCSVSASGLIGSAEARQSLLSCYHSRL